MSPQVFLFYLFDQFCNKCYLFSFFLLLVTSVHLNLHIYLFYQFTNKCPLQSSFDNSKQCSNKVSPSVSFFIFFTNMITIAPILIRHHILCICSVWYSSVKDQQLPQISQIHIYGLTWTNTCVVKAVISDLRFEPCLISHP